MFRKMQFYQRMLLIVVAWSGLIAAPQIFLFSHTSHAGESYSFITKWGSEGSGDGQFSSPWRIAVDANSNIYVADQINNRIQKFSSSGQFLTKWGTKGSEDGQFFYPWGVAVDANGNVYVADSNNHRVQKFNNNGQFVTKWGTEGVENGQFSFPMSIVADIDGNIYVADSGNYRIQKFSSNGQFMTKWGTRGADNGQFNYTYDVAADTNRNIYVSDPVNRRIQKFDNNGEFISKYREWSGQDSPTNIAIGSRNDVYVAVGNDNDIRIQKSNSLGQFVTEWGSKGLGDGQFPYICGIAVDTSGNVYVCNGGGYQRIQKFTPDPVEPVQQAVITKLDGISTNAFITPANKMIAGVLISGGTKRLMVRASSVDGAVDPSLEIVTYPDRKPLGSNDSWATDPAAAELTQKKLAPARATDAATIINLPPGLFTMEITSKNGGSGAGLIEVYDMAVFP